jgi:putative NADPH-quinone reductase
MNEHKILVFYINTETMSRQKSDQMIHELIGAYKESFPEDKYKMIWLPVRDQPTKVELLNPSIETSQEKLDEVIEKIEDIYMTEVERRKRKLNKLK